MRRKTRNVNEDKNQILTQLLLSGEQSMVIEVSDDSAKSDGLHTAPLHQGCELNR